MVFVYLAPLLTNVSGFAADTVPALLLAYGVGATLGNLAGGWLSDRALMPSMIGLLAALAIALLSFWLFGGLQPAAAAMVFVIGALAFSIIPGMQTRVLIAAEQAPTLGICFNASGFQIAAALAAWAGGGMLAHGLALEPLPLVGAILTAVGIILAVIAFKRSNGSSRP